MEHHIYSGTDRPEYWRGKLYEARAEIERLEKEVEALKGYGIDAVSEAYDRGSKSAWNDAIEAATRVADDCRKSAFTADMGMQPVIEAIHALKRSQE